MDMHTDAIDGVDNSEQLEHKAPPVVTMEDLVHLDLPGDDNYPSEVQFIAHTSGPGSGVACIRKGPNLLMYDVREAPTTALVPWVIRPHMYWPHEDGGEDSQPKLQPTIQPDFGNDEPSEALMTVFEPCEATRWDLQNNYMF